MGYVENSDTLDLGKYWEKRTVNLGCQGRFTIEDLPQIVLEKNSWVYRPMLKNSERVVYHLESPIAVSDCEQVCSDLSDLKSYGDNFDNRLREGLNALSSKEWRSGNQMFPPEKRELRALEIWYKPSGVLDVLTVDADEKDMAEKYGKNYLYDEKFWNDYYGGKLGEPIKAGEEFEDEFFLLNLHSTLGVKWYSIEEGTKKANGHMIEQAAFDELSRPFWRYLGRESFALMLLPTTYAAIPFSTPVDIFRYPRPTETPELEKVAECKRRAFEHMKLVGLDVEKPKEFQVVEW